MRRVQNMGSDSPLLRIGGVLYVGTVERIVGTHLLFDASRKRSAGYVGAATVRIVFEEQASAKGSRRKRRAPADRDGENTAPIAENDGRGKGAAKTGAADKVPDEELKQSAVDADKSA